LTGNSSGDGESGRIGSLEVSMRPPEVFVRPLEHGEAVALKRRHPPPYCGRPPSAALADEAERDATPRRRQ
jgi:hypothetical protein